jgi:hypothetical protein
MSTTEELVVRACLPTPLQRSPTATSHTTALTGGALHVDGGQVQLQQAHFNHSAAPNSGAAYLIRTLARIQKCVFFKNEARIVGVAQSLQRDWAAGVGGALGVVDTDVTFEGCSMQQNWAAADGGKLQHGRQVSFAYMPSRVVYGLCQSCMP